MSQRERIASGRLQIGELAALAVTTTRAIRHYHAIGLLPEPARDDSGYRRYGAEDLVRLIRIRRLRHLDMPLEQIAAQLSREPLGGADLPRALRLLADDIARQIENLEELRARILRMAAAGGPAAPAEAWSEALRSHGLLAGDARLPEGEVEAADLLDALHSEGIEGVIAQVSSVISDARVTTGLGPLLERFRALPDDASDELVETLAIDYAALLPRPQLAAPAVDLDTMDKLLGDRLSPAQLRCIHHVRRLLEAGGR